MSKSKLTPAALQALISGTVLSALSEKQQVTFLICNEELFNLVDGEEATPLTLSEITTALEAAKVDAKGFREAFCKTAGISGAKDETYLARLLQASEASQKLMEDEAEIPTIAKADAQGVNALSYALAKNIVALDPSLGDKDWEKQATKIADAAFPESEDAVPVITDDADDAVPAEQEPVAEQEPAVDEQPVEDEPAEEPSETLPVTVTAQNLESTMTAFMNLNVSALKRSVATSKAVAAATTGLMQQFEVLKHLQEVQQLNSEDLEVFNAQYTHVLKQLPAEVTEK